MEVQEVPYAATHFWTHGCLLSLQCMKKVAVVICSGVHEETIKQTWAAWPRRYGNCSTDPTFGMGLTDWPGEHDFDKQRRSSGGCEL